MEQEVWNSYTVQFALDYTIITTTVFALHEDAAEDIAIDAIHDETGIERKVLKSACDVTVELIDQNV